MRALLHSSDRHGGTGTQRSGDLQQHREHAHHRLQEAARGVSGPDLRPCAPRRRAGLRPGHHPAGRRRHRRRRQDRRHAAADDARARCRRPATISTSRSAAKASSRSRCPTAPIAYTRDGSFQMDAQGRIVNAQGNPVQPTITIPQNSSGITINAQGQVSVMLPGSTTPTIGRPDRPDPLHQQGRPAADRRQPVHRHAGLRPAAGRHRQHRRLRRHAAGQPRTGQRRSGLRNLRPDRRPARLRDERQGDQRGRPDAAIHLRRCSAEGADHDRPLALPRHRPARGRAPRPPPRRRATTSSPPPCCAPTSRSPAIWCGSATSSTMPAAPRRSRSIARPISAPPARCRCRRCSTPCARIR